MVLPLTDAPKEARSRTKVVEKIESGRIFGDSKAVVFVGPTNAEQWKERIINICFVKKQAQRLYSTGAKFCIFTIRHRQ